jgi:cytochrome c oxidase subunit II
MFSDFPLFPVQASTTAPQVDALYFFLLAVGGFFSLLIAGLVIGFAIKYRRRPGAADTPSLHELLPLELLWTAVPLLIVMFVFVWSARLYFHISRPPDDTMDVLVVGKRWMWKLQHLNGRREINELHVPVGRAVKLTMTSEDVIHAFYVPAFRVKADVVPGKYTTTWFQATKPGRYHLFCAEYCGTKHSEMGGFVTVMEPSEFESWLAGATIGQASPVADGERLFASLGCVNCHGKDSGARGPDLAGLFSRGVTLASGERLVADAAYVRESIVDPQAKLSAGYQALMPTFRGLVSEEGILDLIAYLKTLDSEPGEQRKQGEQGEKP